MSKLSLGTAEKLTDTETNAPEPATRSFRMEVCDCLVRLGGDMRNEVPQSKVTPAELIVLRAVHSGAETVRVLNVTGFSPLSATGERMRLLAKYPRHARQITEMFPGLAPQFPLTVAEAEEIAAQELSQSEHEMNADPLES